MRQLFFALCLLFCLTGTCQSQQLSQIDSLFQKGQFGAAFSEADVLLRKANVFDQMSSEDQLNLYKLFFESLTAISNEGFSLSEGLLEMEDQKFEPYIELLAQSTMTNRGIDALNSIEVYRSLQSKKRSYTTPELREWHYLKLKRKQLIQNYRIAKQEEQSSILEAINELEADISRVQFQIDSTQTALLSSKVSAIQLNKLLTKEEALLNFFVGDSLTYCIAIKKGKQDILTLGSSKKLKKLVQEYQNNIHGTYRKEQFVATNYQLYQQLIAPLEFFIKGKTRIFIIPDQFLGLLSFENFNAKNPAADQWDRRYKSLDFLIHKYHFSYTYSTGAFIQQKQSAQSVRPTPSILALAPNYSIAMKAKLKGDSIAQKLPTLPNMKQFFEQLQEEYPGIYFSDTAATTANLFKQLPLHDIIQLGAHTIVNEDAFLESTVALAPKATQPGYLDYMPFSRVLLDVDTVKADLIILSSCKTGRGKLEKAQGVTGFAADFSLLGASSIIYSFWSVDEKATCLLLKGFYEKLKAGKSKSIALHEAKLDLMDYDNGRYSAPFYWSGFVFLGLDGAYTFTETCSYTMLIVWMGLIGVLIWFATKFIFSKD